MNSSAPFLSVSEAASQLGVSAKALRLYEQRGLLAPIRSAAGWRAYGPDDMGRAREIAALRRLGFSLAQVSRVLKGDSTGLEAALAAHQAVLEDRLRQLVEMIETVASLRGGLARGDTPTIANLAGLAVRSPEVSVAFDLPHPWGGERFELGWVRPLNYIVGPLGSGKTRLAHRIVETVPNAAFLGLDRSASSAVDINVERTLAWLVEDGATPSSALVALIAGLEAVGPSVLVIDMIEQGLDQATQEATIAHLRRRGPGGRPVFMLTRSNAILDLEAVGSDEAIIFCPANHSPPTYVAPYPGTPGYEAVATCLASPDVRARTEGVIAWRPQAA
ncbi:MAG: MerR family transcriptional regulator [Enhydrobacter sp.]|nr:MerR family transcriptional regulator [Enhydrobacter sp.]